MSAKSSEGLAPPHSSAYVVSVGLPGVTSDLGKEEIDTEGRILVLEVSLELLDVLLEHLGGVSYSSNDSQSGEGRG